MGKGRTQVSISGKAYAALSTRAKELGVSVAALTEVVTSRAIGVPDDQLPPRVREQATRIPTATFATT